MDSSPISLSSQYVLINDTIYIISSSSSGYLKISKAKLNSKVETIKINSSLNPVNRTNFSCSVINNEFIIVIGGDGNAIDFTEIWKFDIKSSKWTQLETQQKPIKRTSGHQSVSNGNLIYVFGGTNGLNISNSLIVITIDCKNNLYTYNDVDKQNNFPCARTAHTMIKMEKSIWLYGGQKDNQTLLGDLWELDYSIFPLNPSWNLIEEKRVPPPRYKVVSYRKGNEFYIAGGISEKGVFYNEVWKFKDQWEQVSIFDCEYPLIGCDLGLLQISDILIEVNQKEPFCALDELFENLKLKEKEYILNLTHDKEVFEDLKNEDKKIKSMISTVEKYMKNKSSPVNEIKEFFSESKQNELLKLNSQLREELSNVSSEVLLKYSKLIKPMKSSASIDANEIAKQLSFKLQHSKSLLEKTKSERKMEIDLYKEHIKYLQSKVKTDASGIDPGDFNSFDKYFSTLEKSQQEPALNAYYRMQLREYQKIISQTQNIHLNIKKATDKKLKYTEIVNKLSDELTINYKRVANAEKELKTWNKCLSDTQDDINKVNEFLKIIKEYETDKKAIESKLKELEEKNNKLQEKYKSEVEDICNNRKEPMNQLLQLINNINDSIKNKSPNEIRKIIDEEYPKIVKLKDLIIPK